VKGSAARDAPSGRPAGRRRNGSVARFSSSAARATGVRVQEAVGLRSTPGADPSELAATLYELANANFYAGHLDVSESLNQRTLTMHREIYGEAHPLVAEDLINLGAIQYERGRYVEAEAFYRKALEINRTWYGKDSYRTASNLTMLGRSYQEKRFDEALLSEALTIRNGCSAPHARASASTSWARGDGPGGRRR
jgi:tetratricopeptide (TPR) repeat protein